MSWLMRFRNQKNSESWAPIQKKNTKFAALHFNNCRETEILCHHVKKILLGKKINQHKIGDWGRGVSGAYIQKLSSFFIKWVAATDWHYVQWNAAVSSEQHKCQFVSGLQLGFHIRQPSGSSSTFASHMSHIWLIFCSHLAQIWHIWLTFATFGSHLSHIWHIWCTFFSHLPHLSHIWHICLTFGIFGAHLSHICHICVTFGIFGTHLAYLAHICLTFVSHLAHLPHICQPTRSWTNDSHILLL